MLILSCFAGAAESLTEALIVNPYDAEAVARAIHEALGMGLAERRDRHGALFAKIRRDDAAAYCQRFLTYLAGARAGCV